MAGVTVWVGEELSEVLFFQANAAESDGLFIDYSLVVNTGPCCCMNDHWRTDGKTE